MRNLTLAFITSLTAAFLLLPCLAAAEEPSRAELERYGSLKGQEGLPKPLSAGTDAPGDIISSFPAPAGYPSGLTHDGTNLWIADRDSVMIYYCTTTGSVVSSFPAPGTTPTGLAWDGTNLWSADLGGAATSWIYQLTTDGSIISSFTAWGPGGPGDSWTEGLTFDGAYLWYSDWDGDGIYQVTTSGSVVYSMASPGTSARGLAWAPDGHLWHTDNGTQLIWELTTDGSIVSSFDAPGSFPFGLTLKGSSLWHADANSEIIYELDPGVTYLPTPTATVSPSATVSATASITPTLTNSMTSTVTATLTATETVTLTPSSSPTATQTTVLTATPTQGEIQIALRMPADTFSEGDPCWLELDVANPGTAWHVDLYVLLDVFGQFFSYPSWQSLEAGLDYQAMAVAEGSSETMELISEFTMPPVGSAGPLFFYAAMFEHGYLDLDHLAGNGALWEFLLE